MKHFVPESFFGAFMAGLALFIVLPIFIFLIAASFGLIKICG
jgi:hypothetical protein